MLVWLSGNENTRWSPNENYARELMELFTLGADRGYTERDVREQARALTGWTNDWRDDAGRRNFRYEADYHDTRAEAGLRAPRHASTGATRAGSPSSTRTTARSSSASSGATSSRRRQRAAPSALSQRSIARAATRCAPVVEAILRHPALYTGPRMVKPPVVYTAGLLRARGRGIDTDAWTWIGSLRGQQLFRPPNVAGWDDTRWLDTATLPRALGDRELRDRRPRARSGDRHRAVRRAALVERALASGAIRPSRRATRRTLLNFAQAALADADRNWKRPSYPVLTQNALRQLVAVSPDLQTS